MVRRLILLAAWFPVVLILLVNNLVLLRGLHTEPGSQKEELTAPFYGPIRASLNTKSGRILGATVDAADGRAALLASFMKGSPLAPYAEYIVKTADANGVDYRLVPAIAMCESNLGKRIPSLDSHNAWGIAVYTGQQHGATFQNWPMAIDWVTKFIHSKFIGRDVIDIREIGAIWAPPSVEKGHSWATCVENFMRQIEEAEGIE